MTSQIVVINQCGIAIASDTLTTNSGYHGQVKTIPSNNKIHQLGEEHLVAILHSGNVFLGNVQWETLVREWSLSLNHRFDHLGDYIVNFEEWIAANAPVFKFDEAMMLFTTVCNEFSDVFGMADGSLAVTLRNKAADPTSSTDKEFDEAVCAALDSYIAYAFGRPPYGDLTPDIVAQALEANKVDILGDFIEHAKQFGTFLFGKSVAKKLEEFACQLLIRFVPTSNSIKLNFVGFGKNDILGQRIEVTIRNFYLGHIRMNVESYGTDNPGDYPMIGKIAQSDAIGAFIQGVDGYSRDMFSSVALEIVDGITALSDEHKEEFRTKFSERTGDILRTQFTQPLLDTLSTLGITGMTRFAEMMIRFQCLRAASIAGEATVGGFVESLNITRDRGIDWHERMTLDSHPIETASHVFA